MEIARMIAAGIIIGIEIIFLYLVVSGKREFLSFIKAQSSLSLTQRPYSFSRVQLLWWTIIICTCTALVFAQKENANFSLVINQTALILLGISLGTTTSARIIDNSDINNTGVQRHQDQRKTRGFLMDILSDAKGLSLHRFQALIFNILFGAVFLINFFDTGMSSLQNFGSTELGLIGISSGGYLALKVSENQTIRLLQIHQIQISLRLNLSLPRQHQAPLPLR